MLNCVWCYKLMSKLLVILLLKLIGSVPICQVQVVSPSRIVCVGEWIIVPLLLLVGSCRKIPAIVSLFSYSCGHWSVGCPSIEQIPQMLAAGGMTCYCWPRANCLTKVVNYSIRFSILCWVVSEVCSSLTPLVRAMDRVPNCCTLAAMLAIKFLAAAGVLSTKAPLEVASTMLLSIGKRPS